MSKMRKRELVVPLSMEPTKIDELFPPACLVSNLVFPGFKLSHALLTMSWYLCNVETEFAVVRLSMVREITSREGYQIFEERWGSDEQQETAERTRENAKLHNTMIYHWLRRGFGV